MQMEGAGPITGPALMAEIGDVRRFKNKKALVAFAGIDAPPFQSGAFESKSRHVSIAIFNNTAESTLTFEKK